MLKTYTIKVTKMTNLGSVDINNDLSNLNINNLSLTKSYKIIVIDYVYNYYYYQKYFKNCPSVKLTDTIRDAVVAKIKEGI